MTSGHIVLQQAATAATDAATAAAPFHISQSFKFSICCTIRAKDSRCGPLFGPLYLQAAISPYERPEQRHASKAGRQSVETESSAEQRSPKRSSWQLNALHLCLKHVRRRRQHSNRQTSSRKDRQTDIQTNIQLNRQSYILELGKCCILFGVRSRYLMRSKWFLVACRKIRWSLPCTGMWFEHWRR